MRPYLRTPRLELREFAEGDLPNLIELDSDPEVMRYLSGGAPTPPEQIRAEVLPRFLRSYQREPGFGVWAAEERSAGRFVGRFSLEFEAGKARREARLGFRLRRADWGKGYATEGSLALVAHGFRDLCLDRISASTYEENARSRHVLEKSGLRLQRRYRPSLEELEARASSSVRPTSVWEGDELDYAIERSEWTGPSAPIE